MPQEFDQIRRLAAIRQQGYGQQPNVPSWGFDKRNVPKKPKPVDPAKEYVKELKTGYKARLGTNRG